MAQTKGNTPASGDAATVTQRPADAAGVDASQAEPTAEKSAAEVKASIRNEADRDLHPTKVSDLHPADRTSNPVTEFPPQERPPVSTTMPNEPVISSLVTGAGAHMPPDPDKYDADGRPYTDANPKPESAGK